VEILTGLGIFLLGILLARILNELMDRIKVKDPNRLEGQMPSEFEQDVLEGQDVYSLYYAKKRKKKHRPSRKYIMELALGMFFLASYLFFQMTFALLFACTLLSLMMIFLESFLSKRKIPVSILWVIAYIGLIRVVIECIDPIYVTWYVSLLGYVGGIVIYLIAMMIGKLRGKMNRTGSSDFTLLVIGMFFIGWPETILAFFLAGLMAIVMEIMFQVLKITHKHDDIALTPYLLVTMTLALYYGSYFVSEVVNTLI
jgi:prepilin signal peptidase PulO-like enzyme (type II secretory pathway)